MSRLRYAECRHAAFIQHLAECTGDAASGHPIFAGEAGFSVYHVVLEYFRNDVRARYRVQRTPRQHLESYSPNHPRYTSCAALRMFFFVVDPGGDPPFQTVTSNILRALPSVAFARYTLKRNAKYVQMCGNEPKAREKTLLIL